MAPLILEYRKYIAVNPGVVDIKVCVTGQHKELLQQSLAVFNIVPDIDLEIMTPGQSLGEATVRILERMKRVFLESKFNLVLVQGDTTSAFVASLAAFYERIPIGHIEAGLRTWQSDSPWPEEMNRRLISTLASLHFAPTERAMKNLVHSGVLADQIYFTGNTVYDALMSVVRRIEEDIDLLSSLEKQFSFLDTRKKLILVTEHRRESHGIKLENILLAIKALTQEDVEIVLPVHLNPNVKSIVENILGNCSGVHLISPLDYLSFVYLMRRSYLVITDSGGVQEEAPSLGKPVLVTQEFTDRFEFVVHGGAKLVGADYDLIVREARELLSDPTKYRKMSIVDNSYCDEGASKKIFEHCQRFVGVL